MRYKIVLPLLLLLCAGAGALLYRQHSPGNRTVRPVPNHNTTIAPQPLAHVVIIIEENKSSSLIIGNSSAPFLNGLVKSWAYAKDYSGVTNPSLPNYLALTSGTTAGITNDCNPPSGACRAEVKSIADTIEASGRSWKSYAESMPAPCFGNNSGNYAVKHNPFMYYPSVADDNARCASHVVPYTQITADLKEAASLPSYSFIIPDLCHDMHDCTVAAGDAWLAQEVPKILASPAFTTQRSLLIITWDEGETGDNNIPLIFAGPAAKKGYDTNEPFNHYSLLHTIESLWGLQPLTANDRMATVMDGLLSPP